MLLTDVLEFSAVIVLTVTYTKTHDIIAKITFPLQHWNCTGTWWGKAVSTSRQHLNNYLATLQSMLKLKH